MRVYISGPMTGDPDYKQKFADADMDLKAKGYDVVNPSRTAATLPGSMTYDEIMRVDLLLLELCDEIYMLKGWKESHGARIEHDTARRHGIRIRYQDE